MKLSVIAVVLLLASSAAAAQPPVTEVSDVPIVAAACDSQWGVTYWSNQTGAPIYLYAMTLTQTVTAPAYLHAVAYLSHPGYASGPNTLLTALWDPSAEPWDTHQTSQRWPGGGVLMRPGEWITLIAACYAPGATHTASIRFSYTTIPNVEPPMRSH